MKRAYFVSFGLVAALVGCGDNSKFCDPGTTMDVDGTCTGVPTTCGDGTILVDDACVIDPNSCQDGTVLVGGECVDPGRIDADIEEAAEPNGLGLFGEASTDDAGTIALKPVGQHFVIHGKIIAFQDADGDGQQDPDIDAYTVEVTGPALLQVSADGMHGLAGGFVALASVGETHPLAPWVRFGVNPTGDTSNRQVYLPAAGTYIIAVTDSRTLFLTGAAPVPAEGKPDFEYYISVDLLNATPTALTVTSGVATSAGQLQPGEVKLFSVPMGEGVNAAELDMTIDHVQESLVITNVHNTELTVKAVADGDPGVGLTAETTVLGIRTNDQSLVVVDTVFDYSNAPFDYDLTVTIGGAGALSTSGGAVSQPPVPGGFTTFYYDIATDGRLIGMDLAFSRAVSGVIVDEEFFIVSRFTFGSTGFSTSTFQTYRGLLNHQLAGRYYFLVFDQTGNLANITATSTYTALMPVAITKGTPLATQTINAFGSNPHTYVAGVATDPWQEFTGNGANATNFVTNFYRPSASFGRLDPLTLSAPCTACNDTPVPVFAHTYVAAGSTFGRILLDDMTDTYLVKVRPGTPTGTPTYALDFKRRPHVDLMTVNAGASVNAMDQVNDATTPVQRYLVRSAANNGLVITVHPDQVTLDTRFQQLTRDEGAAGPLVNNGIAGADDTLSTIQGASGWTAVRVDSVTPIVGGTFDLTVAATAGATYTRAAGTTAFSDACAGGGTVVAMTGADEGRSVATIAAPTGFDFYGLPAPAVRVFANGFLSVDTALACTGTFDCFFVNADMPNAANPNGMIAPYWDDVDLTGTGNGVCQKVVGSQVIIQWTGVLYGTTTIVRTQAILDGSNDTIEFVYDTTHAANGSGGTIGIENQIGGAASKVGFNTAMSVAPTRFTPM